MNKDSNEWRPSIRRGDRPLLILLCLIFVVGFGSAYLAIKSWQPNDKFEGVLKFFGQEIDLTLLFFSTLVAIRCFVSTPQIEKKLASVALKMLVAMMLIGCALTALLFLALLELL